MASHSPSRAPSARPQVPAPDAGHAPDIDACAPRRALRSVDADERPRGPTPLLQRPPGHRAGRGPLLLRDAEGRTCEVRGPLRIGGASDNDLVLDDQHVSQHHLLLCPDGDRLLVRDLGSTNGTLVNGARVQQAEVPIGACLEVGTTRLRLVSPEGPSPLLGESAAMRRVRAGIARAAPTPMSVLVLGESGTGKELVAQALHAQSGRSGEFVALNCGGLTRELIESELFGHEKGAFTGAQRSHQGCFRAAHGGTLFLDEIAELPLCEQPRLLRVLESRRVRAVGATREVPVDVRIVAATHGDLERAVREGRFRQDLYFRLHGAKICLPPLRERPEDVPGLVRHFLEELAGEVPACTIEEEELQALACHPWPGNVRQLRQAVRCAAHLCGPRLTARDILDGSPGLGAGPGGEGGPRVPVVGRRMVDIERDIYETVLSQTGHSRRAAAQMLDIPKSTLHDKLRRLGIGGQAPGPG